MAKQQFFNDPAVPAVPVYWVKAFIFGAFRFEDDVPGAGVTINYGFKETGTSKDGEAANTLTDGEKAQIRDAVTKIQAYADITFVETDAASANYLFARADASVHGYSGLTYNHINNFNGLPETWAYGSADAVAGSNYIYKHEVLHGLGLNHSTPRFGTTNPVVIPDDQDDGTTLYGNLDPAFSIKNDYQLFDIAALQYYYGPPPSQRAGDDTYTLNPGVFDPINTPALDWPLLWDSAGFDTLDYSAFAVPVDISLEPGELSRINGAAGHILEAGVFSINYRTVIEAALGGSADDHLKGNSADNTLNGGGGADTLDGGAGADTLDGLSGDDFYYVDNALDVVHETTGNGNDRVLASVSYTLGAGQDIEKLTTTSNSGTGAIDLTGNELANIIYGNNGANSLDGKAGADNLNGLSGDDFYYVDNALDVVNEAVGGGSDRVLASVSYTLKTGQEIEKLTTISNSGISAINLTGNELANIIYGNNGANSLDGKAGADNLNGLSGDDFYFVDNALDVVNEAVGGGSDRVFASVSYTLKAGQEIEKLSTTSNLGAGAINLTGNELANNVYGNAGTNTLDGGLGKDSLTGLGGHDHFRFDTTLNAATNVDTISDFTVSTGAAAETDKIDLAHAIFSTLATGALAPSAFTTSAPANASQHIIYNTATGALSYDDDGNGAHAAVQFAMLSAHPALTAADILVV